jgi:uncharacterized protein YceK
MKRFLITFLVVTITLFGASTVTSHVTTSDDVKTNELPSIH